MMDKRLKIKLTNNRFAGLLFKQSHKNGHPPPTFPQGSAIQVLAALRNRGEQERSLTSFLFNQPQEP